MINPYRYWNGSESTGYYPHQNRQRYPYENQDRSGSGGRSNRNFYRNPWNHYEDRRDLYYENYYDYPQYYGGWGGYYDAYNDVTDRCKPAKRSVLFSSSSILPASMVLSLNLSRFALYHFPSLFLKDRRSNRYQNPGPTETHQSRPFPPMPPSQPSSKPERIPLSILERIFSLLEIDWLAKIWRVYRLFSTVASSPTLWKDLVLPTWITQYRASLLSFFHTYAGESIREVSIQIHLDFEELERLIKVLTPSSENLRSISLTNFSKDERDYDTSSNTLLWFRTYSTFIIIIMRELWMVNGFQEQSTLKLKVIYIV